MLNIKAQIEQANIILRNTVGQEVEDAYVSEKTGRVIIDDELYVTAKDAAEKLINAFGMFIYNEMTDEEGTTFALEYSQIKEVV